MSLIAHLLSLSGGLLAVLALLLLLSLAVVIERGWFYLHVVRNGTMTTAEITSGASRASLVDIRDSFGDMPQGLVASTALNYLDTSPATLEAAIEHRITEILPSLDRHLWLLDAIATLAPLFGLLGTIVGMVQTFNLLGNGPAMVTGHATGGIADALVATGGGLFVAIVAVIGLSVFNNRLRETVRQLDAIKLAGLAVAHGSPGATEIRPEPIHRSAMRAEEALS